MDEETEKKTVWVREILVAVDTSKHSHAALEAAATLARTMEASIRGIFVHDEMWSRISRLPSVSTIDTLTGHISNFEDDTLENRIRILENRLRHNLEKISRRHEITHSWQTVSGKVEEKILEASKDTDLITIGLKGLSAQRKILGSSARRIIQQSDKPVLILKEGLHLGSTITAVYDGSKESKKGIDLASSIAERNESSLTLLIINSKSEKKEEQDRELDQLLQETTVFPEIEIMDYPDASQLLNQVNEENSGLLIVPKNQPLIWRSLPVILHNINCPILMMN